MRFIICLLTLISYAGVCQNDKKLIVVTLTQTDNALVIYSEVNMAGGSLKFVKKGEESGDKDFANVAEMVNYLDHFGYDLVNTTNLGEFNFTERQADGSRMEGTWFHVQYIFKLRSDRMYPQLVLY